MGTDNIYKYEFVWGSAKFWDKINEEPNFFRNLDEMPDACALFSEVEHLDPVILTAIPSTNGDKVAWQKRAWVDHHLGDYVDVITCFTKDKPNYCKPGDILIDDRAVNREAWIAKGGTYIIHTSAARTVGALQALGIID
jgi:5'(3')-deoxyribonucleotidase